MSGHLEAKQAALVRPNCNFTRAPKANQVDGRTDVAKVDKYEIEGSTQNYINNNISSNRLKCLLIANQALVAVMQQHFKLQALANCT